MKQTYLYNSQTSFIDEINGLLDYSINNNTCFASWKNPYNKEVFVGLGEKFDHTQTVFDLENPLFIFSPFTKGKGHSFFPIKTLFKFSEKEKEIIFEEVITPQQGKQEVRDQEATSKTAYIDQVNKAIGFINIKAFDKVVISKVKKVKVEKKAYLKAFQSLLEELDNSFTSLVYTPQTGLWLGATPELLLEKEGNQLRTVALAGTQPNTFEDIREAFWKQKEIEEQAYVSRYIMNCFKKIRLREFEEVGPKTIKAGNLLHLKTDFIIDLTATKIKDLPDTLLQLIHPTSAICGMPLDEASSFIQEHEQHKREQYSGYLGPLGINNKSSIYVNLRCAQFIDDLAYIYSGAGITEDSIPEKEWEETELKCDTLLKRLI